MTAKDNPPAGNRGAVSEHEGARSQQQDNPYLPVDPVIAPWMATPPCECPEATLLRMIADGTLPLPMSGSFKTLAGVVRAAAVRKLRQLSHDLSEAKTAHGRSWASGTSYAELERRRRITSVMDCGLCGRATEVVHPIEPWQFDALPSTAWVRCDRCSPTDLPQGVQFRHRGAA